MTEYMIVERRPGGHWLDPTIKINRWRDRTHARAFHRRLIANGKLRHESMLITTDTWASYQQEARV